MTFADFPLNDLLIWGATLFAGGLAAGVLAGLFGVGGGIILVPMLDQVLAAMGTDATLRMHVAVGTSLSTVLFTSIRSVTAHHAKGAVDWVTLRTWGPGVLVGSIVSGLLIGNISGLTLRLIFAGVAGLIAIYMAFGRESWVIGREIPRNLAAHGVAALIGAVSVMMGIGGGTFAVSAQTLYGVPIHRAVATSSGLGFIIAIPGTLGLVIGGWGEAGLPPLSLGFVNGLGLLAIVPGTLLAAPLGAAVAHRLPRRMLRYAFAAFLFASALRIGWGALLSA